MGDASVDKSIRGNERTVRELKPLSSTYLLGSTQRTASQFFFVVYLHGLSLFRLYSRLTAKRATASRKKGLSDEVGNVHRHFINLGRVIHCKTSKLALSRNVVRVKKQRRESNIHSISRRMRTSSVVTKLIATPLRPKRPERPMRWM